MRTAGPQDKYAQITAPDGKTWIVGTTAKGGMTEGGYNRFASEISPILPFNWTISKVDIRSPVQVIIEIATYEK
jgi:hypothetical protein